MLSWTRPSWSATCRRRSRRAANTITDPDALREELLRPGSADISLDNVENKEGIRCAGAPVFDHTGRVQAGISVAGPPRA